MLLRQYHASRIFSAVILVAAVILIDGRFAVSARAADPVATDTTAQDALTPAELAGLDALSSSFRKLARLSRQGVVQITVGVAIAAEADPEEVKRLRELLGEVLSPQQIEELARRKPAGSGSGIIFDERGHIVTNTHVVNHREQIEVHLSDDRTYSATLVGIDTKTDVAVIKIDAPDLRPLKFADSDQVEVGDWVLAVGAPFGLTHTVTHGIISATGRGHISGLSRIYYQNFIQTDAPVNPGNSGGPLLNMRGEVLGINTAIITEDESGRNAGIAFAIPSKMALKVARALIEKGVVARGWIGISFSSAGTTASDVEILGLPHARGVLVDKVLAKSPARKAGLQVDDYITAVNSQDLSGAEHFTSVIGDFPPDEQLALNILRDGQPQQIVVELARQPDDPLNNALSVDATIGRAVPQLGITGRALRPKNGDLFMRFEADDRGVYVTDVDKHGPCAKAVAPEEVITAVNDHKVRNLAEMEEALKGVGQQKIRIDVLQADGDQRLEKVTPR